MEKLRESDNSSLFPFYFYYFGKKYLICVDKDATGEVVISSVTDQSPSDAYSATSLEKERALLEKAKKYLADTNALDEEYRSIIQAYDEYTERQGLIQSAFYGAG